MNIAATNRSTDLLPLLLEYRDSGPLPGEKRYQWIERAIRALGSSPGVAERAMLPTEAQIVAEFGLSRQTVRRAMDHLVNEGLITRIAGRGTFLRPRVPIDERLFVTSRDLLSSPMDAWYELCVPLHRRIDISAAGRLRLDTDHVARAEFRRLHDSAPFGYTIVSVPPDIGDLLSDVEALASMDGGPGMTTISELLDRRIPGGLASAEQSITATSLPTAAAEMLGRAEGDLALRIDVVFMDANGRGVELQSSYYLPETYSHRSTYVRTAQSTAD